MKEPEEQFPKYVYVQEVVREPRMYFFKVPKLGSYLAIKLEYDCCLSESALDAAVYDFIDLRVKIREQEEEKKLYHEKLEEEREERERDGETFHHHAREWPQILPSAFTTQKVSYVVCLNTMGQDREFNDADLKLALRTVRNYRDRWEQVEKDNLESDIMLRLLNIAADKEYKENFEAVDN